MTLLEPWASLALALGGVGPLAEALGVTTRTLRRWAAGETTASVLQQRDVRERLRRRGLASPWASSE
jgi:predicted transcriptional regulator